MDITIPKAPPAHGKRVLLGLIITTPVLLALYWLWTLSLAELTLDGDKLVLAEVQRGEFTVSVSGTGILAPNNIQWLATEVEATVISLPLRAGNKVNQGDVIAVLANPELSQQLTEAQWELTAQREEFIAMQVALETDLLEQKSRSQNAQLDYERSQLEFLAQQDLIQTDSVSKLTYARTQLETKQYHQRWATSQQQYQKMQDNVAAQVKARQARLNQMTNRLEQLQRRVNGLQVRATMDGILLAIPLETGQHIMPGNTIAKLAQQDSLIAELHIAEIKIRDVSVGQPVTINTRNNRITGQVARIDPAVINGNVQVDVALTQPLPREARPELSIEGEIQITQITDTLYVEKPLFAQSNSDSTVFRLTPNGSFAERTAVKLGAASPNKIQILSGLNRNDKIIVSDPTRFQNYPLVRLN